MNRTLTRWLVLALAATGLPAALAVSTGAPAAATPAAGTTACSGRIAVTLAADGSDVGSMSNAPSTFGAVYAATASAADQETVTFTPSEDDLFDVTLAAKPGGLEYLGGLSNLNDEPTPDIGPGSENVAFLGAGEKTAPGATPSRESDTTAGEGWPWESAVFTLSNDLEIGMRWVNEDGSVEPTTAVYSNNAHFIGFSGDLQATSAGSLIDYDVRAAVLTLVPDAGADCTFPPATTDCDQARAHLAKVKVKWEKAKKRLKKAQASGNPKAIRKAKAHKKAVHEQLVDAKADVEAECA